MLDDTHPTVRAKQLELLAALEPRQRVAIAWELSSMVDEIALVGIRERHPGCSEHQARLRLAARKYGPDLVERAYGWSSGEAG